MNLDFISFHFKNYRFILIFAVLVAITAGFFSWLKGEKYSVSLNLTVSRSAMEQTQDYKYDSYYALKAADEFGNTVAGWFKTPEMARMIFKKAELDSYLPQNFNVLGHRFKAAKISPNLVEVRFSTVSETEAKNLSQAVGFAVSEKTNSINVSSQQGISFLVTAAEPVIIRNSGLIWRNILAGFLISLAAGFFIQIAKNYLE